MSFPVSKSNMKQIKKTRNKIVKGMKPQLTSLVDVMTILLIYLLKSFSSEGEIITVSKDLMLPESSAQKQPKQTVVLIINNSHIIAEEIYITTVDKVLASDELIIPELNQWLAMRKKETEKIAKYSSSVTFKGEVTIQADKRIRFRLLKKIMYTCGQQEYNNFSLAVLKREG